STNLRPSLPLVFPYVLLSAPLPLKRSGIGMYSNEPSLNSGPCIPPEPVSIPTLSKTTCIFYFLSVHQRPSGTAPRVSPVRSFFAAIRETGKYPLARNGSETQGLSFRV